MVTDTGERLTYSRKDFDPVFSHSWLQNTSAPAFWEAATGSKKQTGRSPARQTRRMKGWNDTHGDALLAEQRRGGA
jgi:hypothetical protein